MYMCSALFYTGNKSDRTNHREIPSYVGEDFARRHDMYFLETSAKEADNVDRLFFEIAKELTKSARENTLRTSFSDSTDLTAHSSPITSISSCCKF